jgi:hypothetical protein
MRFYWLYLSDGSTGVYFRLGKNPTSNDFQSAKRILQTEVDYQKAVKAREKKGCDEPNGLRCQPLRGEPISFPGVD